MNNVVEEKKGVERRMMEVILCVVIKMIQARL
jgi:hypothetical protein